MGEREREGGRERESTWKGARDRVEEKGEGNIIKSIKSAK